MPLTRNQLDTYVDTNVTDKTAVNSLTPTDEGEAIKKVADYVDDNFQLKPVATIYKAIITQSSTSAPVVNNILGENTIGDIVWTRTSIGLYVGTLVGAFANQKTFFSISPLAGVSYETFQVNDDTVTIKTIDLSTLTFMDGGLNKTSLLIEVYP